MVRKRIMSSDTPTDEEIMGYTNVPVDVAARYIGWSTCNIYRALQQERAPFGMAAETGINEETGYPTYTYNISPGLLVSYRNGTLPAWRLNEVIKLAADGIEKVLDERMAACAGLMTMGTGRRGG